MIIIERNNQKNKTRPQRKKQKKSQREGNKSKTKIMLINPSPIIMHDMAQSRTDSKYDSSILIIHIKYIS